MSWLLGVLREITNLQVSIADIADYLRQNRGIAARLTNRLWNMDVQGWRDLGGFFRERVSSTLGSGTNILIYASFRVNPRA